jgi:polysaccharide pyruvyl transferase WcaK-like protein
LPAKDFDRQMKQRKKSNKIVFFGVFGNQNLGNECTLQATMYNIHKALPDAKFTCICTVPEDTKLRHGVPAFAVHRAYPAWLDSQLWFGRRSKLMKFLRKVFFRIPLEVIHWAKSFTVIKGSQMLIVPGTQVVSDYVTGPFSWPYDIFKWSIIAKLCRARLLFLNIGVGPIYHPLSRWFIRASLNFSDYRSYRDIASKQYVEKMGPCRGSDPVYPDLAFSLQRALLPACQTVGKHGPVFGIGLKDYLGREGLRDRHNNSTYRDYLNTLGDLVAWLCGRNCTVRVIIGDVLYDSDIRQDFMELLHERRLIEKGGQIVTEPVFTVRQLLSQIAAVDFLVTSRFHNLVLALMLNKPVVCLSDHAKLDSLMAEIGLAEYCLPLANLHFDNLIDRLAKLEKNAEELRRYIKQKTEEYRKTLDEQYTLISDAFERTNS